MISATSELPFLLPHPDTYFRNAELIIAPVLLEPDRKMLFHLELIAKKYQSNKKQVNGKPDFRVFLYCIPGLFHIGTPVNIIKN